MTKSELLLAGLGLPGRDVGDLAPSGKRFPDAAQVRVEIPSVEGPAAMASVIAAAAESGTPIHRVSQGSGIWMLDDAEIQEMLSIGAASGVEVCLFVGPRAGWDIGRQTLSSSGAAIGASLRGADQLAYGMEDVIRACELGLRSVLVADLGQLMVLGRLKREGGLPADLQLKVSVSLAIGNPATARVMEDLGATSLNLPVDLPVAAIATIRQAVDVPLDIYIEAPDDFGGGMRYHDIPDLARTASPLYLKFAVRNAAHTYPSGGHLDSLVRSLSIERVRRAALGIALLRRQAPDVIVSGDASSVPGAAM
ncbi:U32 family peptidase [Conexibacter sp. CPCC 206217]|uniref:U32 family peptidase n=1 Tax=Conexibacter sp. CPCC 206217 TaxID=3064574 RepID=UPI002723723D|nr:U32 family peptidase [Conexibacter sp. CPCC 206217]MDO8213166.1 U32 family peptidase [Conexibacter sp. CPCC 206217]